MAGQFQDYVHSFVNFIHVHVITFLIHIKTQQLFHVSFVKSGGMYIDICGLFGLSQSSFFHPVHGPLWPTIYALDVALANMVVFKTDIAACKKSAADFAHFSRGMLQHCVCAVDGNFTSFLVQLLVRLHLIYVPNINNLLLFPPWRGGLVIRTRCPTLNEMRAFAAPDLAAFQNRKGFYGIVVMAACTANLEFFFSFSKTHWEYKRCNSHTGLRGGEDITGYIREEIT